MRKHLEIVVWTFFCLLVVALAVSRSYAKPIPPPLPKKAEKQQYPDLNYESNWGVMRIDRNTGEIILREHPQWEGDAQFVTASKVYVVWYWKESGRAAPGIYDLQEDGTLKGCWNWDSDIYIDPKTWEATGSLLNDTIRPVK